MHLTDGVINMPLIAVTSTGAAMLVAYSIKGIKEEEIPKISLLSGAFFVASLISIPAGPVTVHPILGGLMGLVLGRRAPLGIFVGLLLQAILFQHGGITTLGANTLIMSFPAFIVHLFLNGRKSKYLFARGFMAGAAAIVGGLLILITLLLLTDQRYGDGIFSVVNVLVVSHLILIAFEGILTGFIVKFLYSVRPGLFSG